MNSLRAKHSYVLRDLRIGAEMRERGMLRGPAWLFSGHPSWYPLQKQVAGCFFCDLLGALQRTKSIEKVLRLLNCSFNGVGVDYDGKFLDFLFKVCMRGNILKVNT